ncbi:hypothetical protein [Mesorhizobium loti]|uniref:hypothetical protein n=1 Tax=Rhizobium loti TaxID=381 RepID=UPI0023B81306|nr:hypothetical protein [Mesorhizobium loti]
MGQSHLDFLHGRDGIRREAVSYEPCWVAGHDRVGLNILGDDTASRNNGAIADGDAR